MTDRRRSATGPQAYRPQPPDPDGGRRGPIAITPTGILLVIAFVGSVLYLVYALTVRDASQIPLLASGAVVLGIVFLAVAVTGLVATWRSSVRGRDGRALVHAVIGGVACLAAAGSFAVAIILALVGGS